MSATIHIQTPGRICLFGDHQDYLGLPVIACAFDKGITLRATPNQQMVLNIDMPNIQEHRSIKIGTNPQPISSRDYFVSALKVLQNAGCILHQGYDIQITGDLPINAGVSSSSALVVSWVHFLWKAFGSNTISSAQRLGEWAYQAEVVQLNEPGGKMDQYSCSFGGLLYLETGNDFSVTKIQTHMDGMVLGNSGIKKQTLKVLSDVRSKSEEAIQFLQKKDPSLILKKLRPEAIPSYVKRLPPSLQPYFQAAVTNHIITQHALTQLNKTPLPMEGIGDLMNQHHSVLRDLLKITVPTIDHMIDAALQAGAYGAKIVGSGGGGCVVALAPKGKETQICQAMMQAGAIEAYPIQVAKGTHLI